MKIGSFITSSIAAAAALFGSKTNSIDISQNNLRRNEEGLHLKDIDLQVVDDDQHVRGTNRPSLAPSSHPSSKPTSIPTSYPSSKPTSIPSNQPTQQPSSNSTANGLDDDKDVVVCIFPNGTVVHSKRETVESSDSMKYLPWTDMSQLSTAYYDSNSTAQNDNYYYYNSSAVKNDDYYNSSISNSTVTNSTTNHTIPLCPSTSPTVFIGDHNKSDFDERYYIIAGVGGAAIVGAAVAALYCCCATNLCDEKKHVTRFKGSVQPYEDIAIEL